MNAERRECFGEGGEAAVVLLQIELGCQGYGRMAPIAMRH